MQPLTPRQQEVLDFVQKRIMEDGLPPSIREIGEALNISSLRGVTDHLQALERKGYLRRSSHSRGIRLAVTPPHPSPTRGGSLEGAYTHLSPARGGSLEGVTAPPSQIQEGSAEGINTRPSLAWKRGAEGVTAHPGWVGGHIPLTLPVVGRVAAGQPILAAENLEGAMVVDPLFARDDNCFVLRVKGDSMIEAGIFDGDYVVVRQQEAAENGDIVVALVEDEATVKRFFREGKRIRLQPENASMEPIYISPREAAVTILGKVVSVMRKVA